MAYPRDFSRAPLKVRYGRGAALPSQSRSPCLFLFLFCPARLMKNKYPRPDVRDDKTRVDVCLTVFIPHSPSLRLPFRDDKKISIHLRDRMQTRPSPPSPPFPRLFCPLRAFDKVLSERNTVTLPPFYPALHSFSFPPFFSCARTRRGVIYELLIFDVWACL